MKNLLFLSLSILTLIYSCKKDPEYKPGASDYFNLKVGNYWVYEQFTLDTNGVYTSRNILDSNYVEKDTLINGKLYYKYMSDNLEKFQNYTPRFFRDSAAYMVDQTGRIVFSIVQNSDTLDRIYNVVPYSSDTIAFIFSKMTDIGQSITVPAGTFETRNYQSTYIMWPKFSVGGKIRHLDNRYAAEVGLIEEYQGFFLADKSKNYFVRRLVRYKHP